MALESGLGRMLEFFGSVDISNSPVLMMKLMFTFSVQDAIRELCSSLYTSDVLASSMKFREQACALYSNWWPMLSALMYVLVPMPCMFFGGGSTQFLVSRDGGGWIDAAKFLTGASAVGSLAIPMILRHANLIETGAMTIELASFFIFVCTVLCFHRANLDDEW